MPATLKNAPKSARKAKSQARIYEHTENIEPVATKEFVRQELRAELQPIRRDIKWLMGILASLVGIMIYLHSDTSKRMDRIEDELKEIKALIQKK